jgi:hypothetical protein
MPLKPIFAQEVNVKLRYYMHLRSLDRTALGSLLMVGSSGRSQTDWSISKGASTYLVMQSFAKKLLPGAMTQCLQDTLVRMAPWSEFNDSIGGQAQSTLSGSTLMDAMSVPEASPPFIHMVPSNP